jgi:hypothetical protein
MSQRNDKYSMLSRAVFNGLIAMLLNKQSKYNVG